MWSNLSLKTEYFCNASQKAKFSPNIGKRAQQKTFKNSASSKSRVTFDLKHADTTPARDSTPGSLLIIVTVKDALLKDVRACVLQDDAQKLKEISSFLHLLWSNLSLKTECFWIFDPFTIHTAIKKQFNRISTPRTQRVFRAQLSPKLLVVLHQLVYTGKHQSLQSEQVNRWELKMSYSAQQIVITI